MDADDKLCFSILTLNVWGLYLVSKKRTERIAQLCDVIRSMKTVNIFCLQEVWVDNDAEMIIQAGKEAGLSHGIHFRSGTFGSGLVTLSRYPIRASWFQMYASAGNPGAIFCGDYYAKKGVGWTRLETPSGYILDVFNTHLHANYSHKYQRTTQRKIGINQDPKAILDCSTPCKNQIPSDLCPSYRVPNDDFACYRVSQMFELTQFISHHSLLLTSSPNLIKDVGSNSGSIQLSSIPLPRAGIILAGDLNSKPDTLEIELLKSLLPILKDSWSSVHGPNEPGFTCKAPGNTFDSTRQIPERIDYVWTTLDIETCHTALHLTPLGFSYSDHFAVDATVRIPDLKSGNTRNGKMTENCTNGDKASTRITPPTCVMADSSEVLHRGVLYNTRNIYRRRMYGVYGLVAVVLGTALALSAVNAGIEGAINKSASRDIMNVVGSISRTQGVISKGNNPGNIDIFFLDTASHIGKFLGSVFRGDDALLGKNKCSVLSTVGLGLLMAVSGSATVALALVGSWLGDASQARVLTQQILQFNELMASHLKE
mmetsp:Transcript_22485/g.39883  ORF Transcript_22485/g.39883 Transcript_22485/m.39883 type:complete len:541 (-) Transcript_22485:155-1777(-)|eukprot:CAMPEP_0175053814 /NCGR_PEP_ID=MMETSP0052_2-20121109/9143_1 /TAXON_ID=51329 ORGANISM="Polytomella parva, Strain SAG 63-3" /NCGR_SAMPLE_ID=MMETSP0052_2 /ASSEMBLY_ACC=CAM_ASM_000194 /LENGTH=540 /DNA_ID=CAMNT_0016318409 /DNA_START=46 /DNA_END=1668 /DNA_ORIENTATION=-